MVVVVVMVVVVIALFSARLRRERGGGRWVGGAVAGGRLLSASLAVNDLRGVAPPKVDALFWCIFLVWMNQLLSSWQLFVLLVGDGGGRISNQKKREDRERGKEGRDYLLFFFFRSD